MGRGLIVLVFLAACGKSSASMCDPFAAIKLPGITKLDRCSADELSGETTATPAAFAAAMTAAGYEPGRDIAEPSYAGDSMWFKRGTDTFRMHATFDKGENRKDPFFSITRGAPRNWLPEAKWTGYHTIGADRAKVAATLRTGTASFADARKAPAKCPPLAALDPALASAPTAVLVNLDSGDIAGKADARYKHGPEVFGPTPTEEISSFTLDELEAAATELAAVRARRIVPVIDVTSYDEPSVPEGSNILGVFHPGQATFDVGVVDLQTKEVLCRSKAKAASSHSIEGTTTTQYTDSGNVASMSTTAPVVADLDRNMRAAAFAELAKMSDAFPAAR